MVWQPRRGGKTVLAFRAIVALALAEKLAT
jgi:hypothetical protein